MSFFRHCRAGRLYTVELRDPEILGSHYEEALAASGAVHCSTVHSRMPPVDSQVTEGGARAADHPLDAAAGG